MDESIHGSFGTVTYDAVRRATADEPFTMVLTGKNEILAIIEAVNTGIDAHLEACFVPERGDHYAWGERTVGNSGRIRTLECTVSPESLPVLLRHCMNWTSTQARTRPWPRPPLA